MSNAALRSSKIKITLSPLSSETKMSFSTLTSTDSVLWQGLNPDWRGSLIEFAEICACSCLKITFSKTFAKNGKFEIGLKLFGSSIAKFCFFNSGKTMACLKSAGQMPWLRHLFIRSKTVVPTLSKICLKKRGGIASSLEEEGLRCKTMSARAGRVMWWKLDHSVLQGTARSLDGVT